MIFLQDLGEYDLADENFLDVQSITDAMMTTPRASRNWPSASS